MEDGAQTTAVAKGGAHCGAGAGSKGISGGCKRWTGGKEIRIRENGKEK